MIDNFNVNLRKNEGFLTYIPCIPIPEYGQSNAPLVWMIYRPLIRGTQRQFLENICWEDDLRSRIFGTFIVKFLACLPVLAFSNF